MTWYGPVQEKKLTFYRHCEQSEAIQRPWIATPLPAARDDEVDGSPGLVSEGNVSPIFPPHVVGSA